jgi:hypothetical protein
MSRVLITRGTGDGKETPAGLCGDRAETPPDQEVAAEVGVSRVAPHPGSEHFGAVTGVGASPRELAVANLAGAEEAMLAVYAKCAATGDCPPYPARARGV